MRYSFHEKWLLYAGVPEKEVKTKAHIALERAKRFPWPHSRLYFINSRFINWALPFFVLGKLKRAQDLSSNDFELFTKKIKEHSWWLIRIAAVFAFAPLIEVLIKEETAGFLDKHPLRMLKLENNKSGDERYVVIVIGSGAGGAPVARDLAGEGFKVAIIEKGDVIELLSAPRMLEKYYVGQGLTLSFSGGVMLVLAGSTVGGTTSINSGTCLRPFKHCLEEWDRVLNTSFSNGALDPYFSRVEEAVSVCTPPRSLLSKSAELFDRGLQAIGREGAYVLPRCIKDCEGSGRCCFGCPTGAKQSTDYAYLPQAIKDGAQLYKKTKALQVKEKPEGVEVVIENEEGKKTLSANYLVVSGGALFTPGILKKNKLGAAFSIAGRNLKIHPATKVFAYFPDHFHGEKGIPQGLGYRPPELPRITLEGIHTPKSMIGQILSVGGKEFNWWMERAEYLSSFGLMMQDRNTGSIREFNSFPLIDYKLHPEDARDMGKGLILIAEAFFAAGAVKVLLPLSGNIKKEYDSAEELKSLKPEIFGTKSMIISGFHPQGTAGMGRVVDTDLKLLGSKKVYVCDASVLPDSPGVNPQITIMALSLRLAEHLEKRI